MWGWKVLLVAPLASLASAFHDYDDDLDLYGRDEIDLADLWVRDFDDELDIRDFDDEAGLWSRYVSLPEDIYVRDLESLLWSRDQLVHTPAAKLSPEQMAQKTENYKQLYGTGKNLVQYIKEDPKEPAMTDYRDTFIEQGSTKNKNKRVKDLKKDKKELKAKNNKNTKAGKAPSATDLRAQKDLMHSAGRKLAQDLAIQRGIREGKAGPEAKTAWEAVHGKESHNKPLKAKLR